MLLFLMSALALVSSAKTQSGSLLNTSPTLNSGSVTFIENKGQVRDQNRKERPDVLFSGSARGMVYHLRNNGISYQLSRRKDKLNEIYRLDINWVNSNSVYQIKTDEVLNGFENFYNGNQPVLNVRTFKGTTYKNIYNRIDLHYYDNAGDLKYDFIVAPFADYKKIKLEIEGAEAIELQADGSLILVTPFGNIVEGAPVVYQKGKKVEARWVVNKNTLTFEISNYNNTLPLIIDPLTRVWGTYYGGTGGNFQASLASSVRTDASGNVYLAGNTDANSGTSMATTGSHQVSIGGSFDVYLAKFNSSGVRQWATYYGGVGFEQSAACSVDGNGDVYLFGTTDSQSNISTTGSHQSVYGGGGTDCFLVKFNSSGVRQWGTYVGGSAIDNTTSNSSVDNAGNIYLGGSTQSTVGISTAGSHQTNHAGSSTDFDGFLVKFNSNGVRQWGTYYGGSSVDKVEGTSVDASGNVIITGSSTSSTGISTTGSHQSSFGGGTNDAFLAKFNSSGVRQWATYYGDAGVDNETRCTADVSGNIYLVGKTTSTAGIATSSSHQSTFGGGTTDGFLIKFNSTGTRMWGTYFGGSGTDEVNSCVIDLVGNVLITGATKSSSGISTTGSHQTVFGGGTSDDAFIAKFSTLGVNQWGSYYGGSVRESGDDVAVDVTGKLYMAGSTANSGGTIVATSGSHQSAFAGVNNGFLVQFFDCNAPNPPVNTTAASNLTLCSNGSTTITATASGVINWYSSPTSTTVLNSGTTFTTPALASGTYTFFAETTNTCSPSGRTPITVTVSPLIFVSSGAICAGETFTMVPGGVTSFTFSNGSPVVSPTITTSYTVTGVDQTGCTGSAVSTITVNPLPTIAVNSGSVCSGNTFTIQPSGGVTYTFSSISQYVTPTTNSTYTVSGTSNDGCVGSAVCNVTVNPSPTVTVVSSLSVSCKGNPVKLTASGATSYSWSNGASSSSITVSPTITTSYTVTGTGTNTCTKKTVFTQSVNACAGISDNSKSETQISIYPNPNTGSFIVKSSSDANEREIRIYNAIGQLILSDKVNLLENKIDLSQSPNGIYFVEIIEKNVVVTSSKIIKE